MPRIHWRKHINGKNLKISYDLYDMCVWAGVCRAWSLGGGQREPLRVSLTPSSSETKPFALCCILDQPTWLLQTPPVLPPSHLAIGTLGSQTPPSPTLWASWGSKLRLLHLCSKRFTHWARSQLPCPQMAHKQILLSSIIWAIGWDWDSMKLHILYFLSVDKCCPD